MVGSSHFGTVLLVDTSDSMKGAAIRNAVAAASTFLQTHNPRQRVGIVFFDSTTRVVAPLTTDPALLARVLTSVPALHFGTHIFDAATKALNLLSAAHVTDGSIIVLSDGRDVGSRASEKAFAAAAVGQGVRVYTVGVRDASYDGSTLQGMAAATAGVYQRADSRSLVQLYRALGVELSNQYLIRYRSVATLGHPVKVVVNVSGFGAATSSYQAPRLPGGGAPVSRIRPTFWTSRLATVLMSIFSGILIGLALLLVMTRRRSVRDRMSGFISSMPSRSRGPRERTLAERALGDPRRRSIERSPWLVELAAEMDMARIELSIGRLMALTAVLTVLLGWAMVNATSSAVAAPLGAVVPIGVVAGIRMLAKRQRRQFDEQLPDNLQVIASALRAGYTFAGALSVVVEDAPEPSRREFRRALADEQLGILLADALDGIAERMRSEDFRHVVLVARLQQDTGGNTAEVLDVVTDTIRDRLDLRRLVRTLTAQGRLAGGILSVLPVVLLLGVSLINPSYTHPLFHNTAGIAAMIIAAIMAGAGAVIIRRIVDIEV